MGGLGLGQCSAFLAAGALGGGAAFLLSLPIVANRLGVGLGPRGGQQRRELLGRQWRFAVLRVQYCQSLQDVAQVGPHVQMMSRGASHDRVQHGRAGARLGAADEQPVFSADRERPQIAFDVVVIDRQAAIVDVVR